MSTWLLYNTKKRGLDKATSQKLKKKKKKPARKKKPEQHNEETDYLEPAKLNWFKLTTIYHNDHNHCRKHIRTKIITWIALSFLWSSKDLGPGILLVLTTGPDGSPGTSVAVEYLTKEANSEIKLGLHFYWFFSSFFSKDVSTGIKVVTSWSWAPDQLRND